MIETTANNDDLITNGKLLLKRIDSSYIIESGCTQITESLDRQINQKARDEKLLTAEEWDMIFDSVTEMVSIHSDDFTILRVNAAFCNYLNMKSADIEGQTCYRIIHGSNEPPACCPLIKTFKERKPYTEELVESYAGDFWKVTVVPVTEKNGDNANCIHIMRNMTQQIDSERKFRPNDEPNRAVIEDTVEAIAAAVELRDPYTAGHQLRVAHLANAIATEMGLADEQIHSIRLAALVHDIGKIHVPSEILSKPSRISDIEFGMVKMHPFAGFNILRKVRFPWPLADIVLQHHERMNGSGYPSGLQGGNILLESRVMAVADVIEAMSSDRPYRSTPGIYEALKEIAKKAGVEYDTAVVIACLKLFKEKNYTFPQVYNGSDSVMQSSADFPVKIST